MTARPRLATRAAARALSLSRFVAAAAGDWVGGRDGAARF